MTGLVPVIHAVRLPIRSEVQNVNPSQQLCNVFSKPTAWMAGTSPAKTDGVAWC